MKLSGKLFSLLSVLAILLSCASPPAKDGRENTSQSSKPDEKYGGGESFVVTQDVYKQTFSEIEALVAKLSEIISDKNYEEWLSYLSPDYVEKTSSPVFLKEASKSAILQKDGIVLKDLQDYFLNVVVPSRVQATLEDISFIDSTHVKAISLVNGKPVILYWLVWVDSRWMIGIQ
jgi:hypothetical protein